MDDLEARDLFAMFAMAGIIFKLPFGELERDEQTKVYETTAFSAYEYADAMIAARKPLPAGLPEVMKKRTRK